MSDYRKNSKIRHKYNERKIMKPESVDCPRCKGNGKNEFDWRKCKFCHGKKEVTIEAVKWYEERK